MYGNSSMSDLNDNAGNSKDDIKVPQVDSASGITALAPSIFSAREGETIIRELFPKDVDSGGAVLCEAFDGDPWLVRIFFDLMIKVGLLSSKAKKKNILFCKRR